MGCRIIALERGSNKVKILANELNIPYVLKPFTKQKMELAFQNSKKIDINTLMKKYELTIKGLDLFWNEISNNPALKKLIKFI